jgi:hypothetical protein
MSLGVETHKVIIDTDGITDEQKRAAKFRSAYQDMMIQLTASGFAHVLCCHEAAHLFYFMRAGTKNYKAFPARLRYDHVMDDYFGSLGSVRILDIPKAATASEFEELLLRVAKAHAAGGVVSRKLMSSTVGPWNDPTGGDQDDKERLVELCNQLNASLGGSRDADALWKAAQSEVAQELSDHPDVLDAIEQLASKLRPELGL